MYESLCSAFSHSWIPLQGTWTFPLAAVYCRSLAAYTDLGFWRDTLPRLFQCWYLFRLGRTQLKTDQVHVEDPAAPNLPPKANDWSWSSQKWYTCRLGCDCLSNLFRLWWGVVTSHQVRNKIRWRPWQITDLAPPCSNLRSFGSKSTVLKNVLVTLLGLFGSPRSDSALGELCAPCPPRYAPALHALISAQHPLWTVVF